jgi:hypothetical protein
MLFHPANIEQLEARRLAAGVTIVTHGFGSSFPKWVDSMVRAVVAREGTLGSDVALYKMTVASNQSVSMQNLSTPLPNSVATGEVVIELDWSALSGFSFTSTTTVARAVVQSLLSPTATTGLGGALAELPFHLIGHSRGASLVTDLARQLGLQGVWVDQVTTLDPHPVTFYSDAGSPDDANTVALYDNVIFGDNYYRDETDTLTNPGGHAVRGANNFHLNGVVTTTSQISHSNVHTYYHGTVDLSATTDSDGGTVDPSWYAGAFGPRNSVGYAWSRIVGSTQPIAGIATRFGGAGDRYAIISGARSWSDISLLNKTQTGTQFTIGEAINTSFKYQDFDSSSEVYLYLDRDRNPYNGNFAAADPAHPIAGDSSARGHVSFASTGASVINGAADLFVGGSLLTGTNYYICAKITDGTHKRFAYLSTPLTFISAGPKVVSSGFGYETAQTVSFSFDQDLGTIPTASAMSVKNLGTNIVTSASSASYNPASHTVTFGFSQVLPDGNYIATLLHGSVTDTSGNPLASDAQAPFFVLAADANRDGQVNPLDFGALASNFNGNGRTFSSGDFNYDGRTNALDFNLLAANFGKVINSEALPGLSHRTPDLFADGAIVADPATQA